MKAQAANATAAGDVQKQADDEECQLQAEVGLSLVVHACRAWAVRLCLQQHHQHIAMLQASAQDPSFADGSTGAAAGTAAAQVSEFSNIHVDNDSNLSLCVCMCLLPCLPIMSAFHASHLFCQGGLCMTALVAGQSFCGPDA